MAAAIVAVMRFGNTTRVVAELPDELVVFTSSRGTLEPYHRGPLAVEIRPYFDSRWLKVRGGRGSALRVQAGLRRDRPAAGRRRMTRPTTSATRATSGTDDADGES